MDWTASVHTLHMSKPNVTRVQSATQWTASVHTLHTSKPNVTRVQSATQWTASVHTLHMSKPNVTRVQSATQWTAEKKRQWHTCARKTPEKREGQNGNRNCSETQVLNKNAKKKSQIPSPPTICFLHEVLRLPLKYCSKFSPIVNSMILSLNCFPNKHKPL